jgi:Family of unknown function (DUF5990)
MVKQLAKVDSRVVELTIECGNLPPYDWGGHSEIWLGIQRGKDVVQAVKLPAEVVVFDAELRFAPDSSPAGPNFLGQYAHGTVGDRFVYLCWGRRQGQVWVGFRRAKLKLSGLTWESLQSGRLLAKVRCTDAKGGPICATVPEGFVSWS